MTNKENNTLTVTDTATSNKHKTPTERLLDVYVSQLPAEIEDTDVSNQMRDCPTTEDEDDAIDGLLALSNSSLKTVIQSNKQAENDKRNKNKNKKNEKGQ